jgi:undecaprenyl-diphosphatase
MTIFHILILAIIQGAAELLPVSSSAHVIVAEKLMGMDPTRPEMTLLLVMLHTGTMFAVICYFWKSWKATFFASWQAFREFFKLIVIATIFTGIVGLILKALIEKIVLKEVPHAEIEMIFGNLTFISISLAVVGVLIIYAGLKTHRAPRREGPLGLGGSCWMGAVQGLCLPFRGFSRSGATISTGLILGLSRKRVEDFSFALAVVLTPPVIAREVLRVLHARHAEAAAGAAAVASCGLKGLFLPSLLGMAMSFVAGLLALKWLSAWLEEGRWYLFGIYCICISMVVFVLSWSGM